MRRLIDELRALAAVHLMDWAMRLHFPVYVDTCVAVAALIKEEKA